MFSTVAILCILINTGAMASQHSGQSAASLRTAEIVNDVMAVCFTLEITVRIISDGPIECVMPIGHDST